MISGGPVYISDKPGRHDPTLLARLALPGGRLLQPLLPGRPCRDTLFVDVCGDGVSALKVWNMNACGGVLALFNVQVLALGGSLWV
jgi:raffinose synthase